MGGKLSKFGPFRRKRARLLMVGLDGAGKTSEFATTKPVHGRNQANLSSFPRSRGRQAAAHCTVSYPRAPNSHFEQAEAPPPIGGNAAKYGPDARLQRANHQVREHSNAALGETRSNVAWAKFESLLMALPNGPLALFNCFC